LFVSPREASLGEVIHQIGGTCLLNMVRAEHGREIPVGWKTPQVAASRLAYIEHYRTPNTQDFGTTITDMFEDHFS